MFILELYDSFGNKLKMGDVVKVSNGRNFCFYAEVKYLEKEKVITPFHTFSFHSFEKIDTLPENLKKATEERYNIWFQDNTEEQRISAEGYLSDWRQCEHLLEKGCYRIEKA